MNLAICSYREQVKNWPENGRHILAQYTDDSIIVYQAYQKEIGHFAVSKGYFGGAFSYARMSWIKPNFLWMMYRSGWGTKPGQEVILAVRISRAFFDEILEQAVVSTFHNTVFRSHDEWKHTLNTSEVRLQWDPDHLPTGDKVERRAIQLGLRGDILEQYGKNPLEIMDISEFVSEQREYAKPNTYSELNTPCEKVYVPQSEQIRKHVLLSSYREYGEA